MIGGKGLRIIASAPGKVILFGEHFVVKNRPAIAVALELRLRVTVSDSNEYIVIVSKNTGGKLVIDTTNLTVKEDYRGPSQLLAVLKELKSMVNGLKPAYINIESEIPVAAGLGSSASLAVAFTAAYSRYLGLNLSREEISRIAYEAERIVHGKPSGIDNTIASLGGAILYHKNSTRRISISKLDEVAIVIADTGIERSTREAVLSVLSLYDKHPRVMEKIYEAAEEIIREAEESLSKGDWIRVGELMNINHGLLSAIGVSILELEKLVYLARKSGALGAKITGAGMGGSIIALTLRENVEQVVEALRREAKRVISTGISEEGVVVREKNC